MHNKASWSWWIDASFLHSKFEASPSCFFSHIRVNLLSHSNRERMLVTVNKNNESWKKLNLAQTFTEKLETFDHTWLNKIKQNYYMKSSFSNLSIKCTLVHSTFHAQWKHSPKAAAAFYLARQSFLKQFLWVSVLHYPQKFTDPLWGERGVTCNLSHKFQCAFTPCVSAWKECNGVLTKTN